LIKEEEEELKEKSDIPKFPKNNTFLLYFLIFVHKMA